MSYEQLTAVEKNFADGPSGSCPQRLFRLLGLAPGPDVGVLAAAALIDRPAEDVEEVLEQLVDACLLECPAPGRYRMHDLLRVFAAECAEREESEAERSAARARVVRWYLLGMTEADLVLFPGEARPEPLDHAAEQLPPHRPLGFADRAEALEWCAAERVNVIHAAQLAAQHGPDGHGWNEHGLDEYGWRFCSVAWAYFNRTAHLEDWLAVADAGLVSVRRLDRPYAQGTVLTSRGAALMRLGETCRARESFLESLEIRRSIGDRSGQVALLNNLGLLAQRDEDHDEARAFFRQALELAAGPDGGPGGFAASSLYGNLGQSELALGDYAAARDCLERSLAFAHELGNRSTESVVLRDIGLSYLLEGRPAEALPHLDRAVATAASTGYRVMEAGALTVWARALVALDRPAEAEQLLDRARAVEATLDALGQEAVHELITRMARELSAAEPQPAEAACAEPWPAQP
jgi:tetratricopeptide (TPR) repeat protein